MTFAAHPPKVYLIESYPDAMKILKSYFSEINAVFSVFGSFDLLVNSERPDLVIMPMNKDEEKFREDFILYKSHPVCAKVPLILIAPFGTAKPPAGLLEKKDSFFPTPVDKLVFLQRVAESLGIPPRRVFRIIVSISEDGNAVRYSAISVDFSESGMSFECSTEFKVGHKFGIRFVNPKTREKLCLQIEIVRRSTSQSGKIFFYGVRFVRLSLTDIEALRKFVTGKN